jgi:hypothetical protein
MAFVGAGLSQGEELDIPPDRHDGLSIAVIAGDKESPRSGDGSFERFGRGSQQVRQQIFERLIRADGTVPPTEKAAHAIGGSARELFPGVVDEQQPTATIEDKKRIPDAL